MAQLVSGSRRRDKPILSCAFCRGRKLRCDRQCPCSACIRRGQPSECVYSSSEQTRRDAIDYRPRARNQQARQRVARLENLVTEMRDLAQRIHQPASADAALLASAQSVADGDHTSPLAPLGDPVADSMGKLSLSDNHAVYVGSSHWGTILQDIQSLKDELSNDHSDGLGTEESILLENSYARTSSTPRVSLLNMATCLSRDQILAMIPERKVVDRLVSQCFNTFDVATFILHREKFLAEYSNFWANPSSAPIMWVGLLFSVMSISAYLRHQDLVVLGTVKPQDDQLETFRTLTIHCLMAGDYLRPSHYTIETLVLHFAVDHMLNFDSDISNWIMIGIIIRIALRMGLHRDPSHWPYIRPLQAEIRRRIWIALYQMDFFTSAQVGLPRIIKDFQCDARPPAHLLDHEIGAEHDETPPERPMNDPTPISFVLHRQNIIKVAAEIYDATEAVQPSAGTVAALAVKLENAINAVPLWLRFHPLDTLVVDQPETIMQRMFLDILIHKAVYLLHRRSFMKASASSEERAKSNELCIQAALAILEHQRRVNEETQPGGLMFGIRWKVATSLNHEFLQATMMLCFVLNRFNEGTTASVSHRPDNIAEALTTAKGLWEQLAPKSADAQRAARTIATILKHGTDKSTTRASTHSIDPLTDLPPPATQPFAGNFDFVQNMALDPSFTGDDDMIAFGDVLNDFGSNNYDTIHSDMFEEASINP